MGACCAPSGGGESAATSVAGGGDRGFAVPVRDPAEVVRRMVRVDGGAFRMGAADPDSFPDDGEGPVRTVTLRPYYIDAACVTNAQFATFAKATGYVTDAERIGWSFVFAGMVGAAARADVLPGSVPGAPWWSAVRGATWRTPEGAGSTVGDRQNHPVVHVSHADAGAYAAWAGKRLPTEAEWEMAARGGLDQARFPWGDELTPKGRHRCNIWQGTFPTRNTAEDGFAGTAPVKAFTPNAYGLYNTSGNVWEWCADWFSTTWHAEPRPETRHDPAGPPDGTARVIRGGSYMCHYTYCNRYRAAARTSNTPDSSTGHMGFRCAAG
ncbi:MAG TPA: formylglycine-generating enzyme family protein [Streptosporangiaceae bacterium]